MNMRWKAARPRKMDPETRTRMTKLRKRQDRRDRVRPASTRGVDEKAAASKRNRRRRREPAA